MGALEVKMTPVQFDNITILKSGPDSFLGFHNLNLEVAHLSSDLMHSFFQGKPSLAMDELKAWSASINDNCKTSIVQSKVRTLTLNTTQLCNLKCTYCAAGGDGTYGSPRVQFDLKKGLPQLDWLLQKCAEGETFQINFLGGEPLLYPDVVDEVARWTVDRASERGVKVRFAVVTNGTRLHEHKVMALLVKHKMAVTVSVDGPPQIQNKFRPTKKGTGSSELLELGLSELSLHRGLLPSIGLSAVFHKEYTDVVATYDYFKSWNFDFYEFNFSHTEFDAEASSQYALGLSQVAAKADTSGGEVELRKIRSFDLIFQRLDEQLRVENFCGAGKSLLSMDARGMLYSCPWEINEKELSLGRDEKDVSTHLKRYAAAQLESRQCSSCWARFLCGGGCQYIHTKGTGSPHRLDGAFCERTKAFISTVLIYYQKYRGDGDEAH